MTATIRHRVSITLFFLILIGWASCATHEHKTKVCQVESCAEKR